MRALLVAFLLVIFAADTVLAQDVTINISDGTSLSTRTIQLFALITVLSLVPGLAVMITCFPFIVTVLSILRQAIGLQQAPPNMLIVTLALFLTYFVMDPVLTAAWQSGVQPMMNGELELEAAVTATLDPFRTFMAARVDPDTFAEMAALRDDINVAEVDPSGPLSVLIPSFLLSEISRAFQIGFLLYLPFLIIDLVVSAVLMSMGMMMVPPVIVSLPFKLAFFVIADGWALVAGALVRGYM